MIKNKKNMMNQKGDMRRGKRNWKNDSKREKKKQKQKNSDKVNKIKI